MSVASEITTKNNYSAGPITVIIRSETMNMSKRKLTAANEREIWQIKFYR